MFNHKKFSILTLCLSGISLFLFNFGSLEAACGGWGGAHNYERGAWGGNGGWWGDSRSDWYGEYGTPEEYDYFGNYTTPNYRHYHCPHKYYSKNQFPFHGQYYSDSVDGAGLYFTIRH